MTTVNSVKAQPTPSGESAQATQAKGGAPGKVTYRYDLDGLRGLAIALVVIFHVFIGRVSGGVDVFLLLSGYFFLGAQLRYALRPNPSLNPWWPFWRTARRLVPNLAVVLLTTYAAVVALTPELLSRELARQFKASILYYQNIELTEQALDYAAAGSHTSPLQHLWSMSVQGQFYVVAISLGILTALAVSRKWIGVDKARTALIIVLALMTAASFCYASRFGLYGTGANYYSLLSRFWELGLGGLLSLLPIQNLIKPKWTWLTASLGVFFILITGLVIDNSLAFPGPLALLPLGGAALVVLSGPDNPTSRVLASEPMRWLGRIAYGLYLWHWPLLILWTVRAGVDTPPWQLGLVVIGFSLALAHFTHKVIEDPLRQHGRRPKKNDKPVQAGLRSMKKRDGRLRAIGGFVIVLFVAGVLAIKPVFEWQVSHAAKPLGPDSYPGAMALHGASTPADVPPRPDPSFIGDMYPPIAANGCMVFMDEPSDKMPPPHCIFGDKDAETTVVLFGGSHAETWIIPLDELGKKHNFKIITFIRQACPLVLNDDETVSPQCAEWSRLAIEKIKEIKPDLAVSNSTRPAGQAGAGRGGADLVPWGYQNVWAALQEADIPFLGIRDNPWNVDENGDEKNPNDCMRRTGDLQECSILRSNTYAAEDPSAYLLLPENKQFSLDTADFFCDATYCPPIIGNVYVYRDDDHMSNAFAATTTPLVWMKLQRIFDELGIPYTK
ncbi:acyltransferase family protein [Corynebacterium aquatimens]|uniref:Peptidoglycan/LPS O-acetylase OafA/YrhL n=1 Tax=Corynebacterium aquatimens TaxID=1190508 RepID=A0A931GXL6_9CORY|nr:acyltransferase family protein [Corynebacterium aquatimens]MBG6121889.1 peptidoglycan/LPS O-acetylase OafA/YrhL [Corynebacterium aquatimens]WJY65573.1 O-acetyltransferase OatA [Corynebacterium aquatimens]